LGGFMRLPVSIATTNHRPVLSDALFAKRQQQLLDLKPAPHLELEELHTLISQQLPTYPLAIQLQQDLEQFLGWRDSSQVNVTDDPDLAWIKTIAEVGNSSDGNLFEKLVRKGLLKLGFANDHPTLKSSLDPEGCGGAGGLDFYCNQPYQVVGECKATKTETVPSETSAQLIHLGNRHLSEDYERCIKVIVAAGALNFHAQQTSRNNQMNVIKPETLERLVTLKAKHPGAINLLELKPCLENSPFGQEADAKLNQHIDQIEQSLNVYSNLIKAVKKLHEIEPDRSEFQVLEIRTQYNALFANTDMNPITPQTAYELLIELASPLSGYLGRTKVSGISSDCFYFLRDLN
jgi:hypothetical protein